MSRRFAAVAALVAVAVVVLAVVLLTSKGSSSSSQSPPASASAPAQSAAAGTPASGAKAAVATTPLSGGSFATAYPKGYRLTLRHGAQGAARYQLSSTGAAVNSVEIPARANGRGDHRRNAHVAVPPAASRGSAGRHLGGDAVAR